MNFTKDQIMDYADKLLMGLNDDEAETILNEFSVIDENINQINEIEGLENIEPATSPFDLYVASLREDTPEDSVPADELLKNTKDKVDREIRVPKVVD
jgi:aspartyl-tRNA(Asn)/glutamyl-tRNA(Gln) amidotransferase subunit C